MQSVYARTIYRPSDILFNRRYQVRHRPCPNPLHPYHFCTHAGKLVAGLLLHTHAAQGLRIHPINLSGCPCSQQTRTRRAVGAGASVRCSANTDC